MNKEIWNTLSEKTGINNRQELEDILRPIGTQLRCPISLTIEDLMGSDSYKWKFIRQGTGVKGELVNIYERVK